MKSISKWMVFITMAISILMGTACGQKQENISGNLEEIMSKVYASIPEEERPMYLENIELTKENIEGYIGTSALDFKEAIASESMTGSIAHSVVLIRMENEKDVEEAKKQIKEHVDPRKWICVGVENVLVESRGDLIIVILDDDNGEKILNDFKNIKAE